MNFWSKLSMSRKIVVMMCVGIAAGVYWGPAVTAVKPVGDLFLRLLKMLIVPLVFFTLVAGVTSMESPDSLKKIGAGISTAVALALRPGRGAEGVLGSVVKEVTVGTYSAIDTILNWIPENPVASMANMNMIQVIFFALITGVALLHLKDRVPVAIAFSRNMADVMIKITEFVMGFAPYGIGALVACVAGTIGGKMMTAIAKFFVADYAAVLVGMFVVYPLALKIWNVPALRFFKHVAPAMLVAATTTSSAATLPMEMNIAEEKLGLDESVYGFSLPLGNTMNMTAAFGVIAVFAFDIFGVEITPLRLVQTVLLGLMLAVGAAGVKGAGIVMSAVFFESLGLPLGRVPILAAIWPVIDIPHTTGNVTGDMVGTMAACAKFGKVDWNVFNADA